MVICPKRQQVFYEERLRNIVPYVEIEERARNLFRAIDRNGDHHICAEDMAKYLKANGIFFSRKDFRAFMKQYDHNSTGSLDWLEFWHFVKDQENHIRRVFRELDSNLTGELEDHEFLEALHRLGIPATKSQVQEFITQFSHDHSKKITYAEWYEFLHTNQFFGGDLSHINFGALWEDLKHRRSSSIIIDVDDDLLLPESDESEEYENYPPSHPKWKYMIGGGIAASISRTLTAPLDRLRCLLQLQTMKHAMTVAGSDQFRWRSSWQILRDMGGPAGNMPWMKRIHGYYRGNMMAVAKVAPEIAIRNFIYEHLKSLIVKISPDSKASMELQWYQRFIAVNLSAVSAQALLYPFEYIKTALQMSGDSMRSLSVPEIIRAELRSKMGWRHMWTGLSPSLIRVAGDISIYETFKKIHYEKNKAHEDPERRYPSVPELLLMGSCASAVAQTVTFPLLFVRTALQAQSALSVHQSTPIVAYKGTMDAFRQIVKREGVRGLYTGWGVNLFKTVPTVTTTFVAYELVKRQMGIYY
jgi:solute carrier family 25 phosphate transporter 23/24/25/41